MPWLSFLLATLAAGVGATGIDWFFARGVFPKYFGAHPEIWRQPANDPHQVRRVGGCLLLNCVTAAAFFCLCHGLHLSRFGPTLRLAGAICLVAPLPMIAANALWMKLHPLVAVSQSLCWLGKLALAALAAAWLLSA
jgi:hypothetical protein